MRAARPAWFVFVIVLSGCGNSERNGVVRTTESSVNGVLHVQNTGAPPVWSTHELVSLGKSAELEQGGPDEFGRITSVIAGSAGEIYVSDASTSEIRVFDAAGKFLRRFGRKGGGPGEFMMLQSIGWLGDTLAVMDAGNARIGLLTGTGEWVGQRPLSRITGAVRLHQTALNELYSPVTAIVNKQVLLAYVRQTMSGSADTLPAPKDQANHAFPGVRCDEPAGQAIHFWNVDFAPRLVRGPAPGQQLIDLWSADYRVAFRSAKGDTVRVIERDVPAVPPTDAEWSSELAKFSAWRAKLPPATCTPREPERPATKDLIRGVYFDDANRIWVERRDGLGFAFDVFNAAGRLLGSVTVPEHVDGIAPFIRGDRVYLVTRDSLDVQHVKAFSVTPG